MYNILMKPIIYTWPNGRKSIAGGTRTTINLDRPWQKELKVNPATCPFCNKPQKEVRRFLGAGGWRLLQNMFTPFRFHQLLTPARCWGAVKLKRLGGRKMIEAALRMLSGEIQKYPDRKFIVDTHIGYSAGQNAGHLHWHLIEYPFDGRSAVSMAGGMRKFFQKNPALVLSNQKSSTSMLVGVGGIRAGQCFFIPNKPVSPSFLARKIYSVISTYKHRFRSKQGLSPDYSLLLSFNKGKFEYAIYTPILNNLGAFDLAAFYDSKWPVTLPWPHETTVQYLKNSTN